MVSLLPLFLSCQQGTTLSVSEKQSIAQEINQTLHDYHSAIEKGGLLAEFTYLDSSADFFWVPPGYTSALSYDSVKTVLTNNAPTFQSIQFEWDTLSIFVHKRDLANFTGIVKSVMTDTAGVQSKMAIIESGTLIKRLDGWKLLNGQSRLLDQN